MRIEDEIKQSSFLNEFLKAHINVMYTAAWAGLAVTQLLKPFNISHQQFNILRILRGRYPRPASIRELTDRMMDKSSNASRLVDKLAQKGFVQKNNCSEDLRQLNIIITPAGLSLVGEASEALSDDVLSKYERLSLEEATRLNELLDKIRG
jgi:DNA-binding MarR family transcriptional regulator